jgi:hypothetical protein
MYPRRLTPFGLHVNTPLRTKYWKIYKSRAVARVDGIILVAGGFLQHVVIRLCHAGVVSTTSVPQLDHSPEPMAFTMLGINMFSNSAKAILSHIASVILGLYGSTLELICALCSIEDTLLANFFSLKF